MSDTPGAPPPEPTAAPSPGAEALPPEAPPAGPSPDDLVRLRRENAMWRTRAQTLEALDDGDLEVLDPLFQALRSRDANGIAEWVAHQWNSLDANARAQFTQQGMSPPQTGMPVGDTAGQDGPLTRAEFQRLMAEERRQAQLAAQEQQRQQIEQQGRERMFAEFREINVDPSSPLARAIATKVVQMGVDTGRRDVTLAEAHAALKAEWAPMFAPQAGAAPGSAAPGAPPVLPSGVPTRDDAFANMTPKEKALHMAKQLSQRGG